MNSKRAEDDREGEGRASKEKKKERRVDKSDRGPNERQNEI